MSFSGYIEILTWIGFYLYYALVVLVSIYILLEKRSPARTLSWILALVFLPGLGLVWFLFFGRNLRRKRKRYLRRLSHHRQAFEEAGFRQPSFTKESSSTSSPTKESSLRASGLDAIEKMLVESGVAPAFEKAKVQILVDGAQKLPALFSAMQAAQSYIFLEYYILDEELGNKLLDLLSVKAGQGLDIRLIIDDIGSWKLSRAFLRKLKKSNIQVQRFMPVFSVYFADRANYRNHRKIVVIDGSIGFTGGMNLSDQYLLEEGSPDYWRDIHLRIEGPPVTELEKIFLRDWAMVHPEKRVLRRPKMPPRISQEDLDRESCRLQIIGSGPLSEWPQIQMAYFAAITLARRQILIASPYFLPDESILMALKTAALRGVDVKILVPRKTDSWFLDLGNFSFIEELLHAGLQIRLFVPGFNHSKLMVLDGELASIGSANMDHRSFEQNFEVLTLIYNKDIATRLSEIFFQDWERSIEPALQNRSLLRRMLESLARMIAPVL